MDVTSQYRQVTPMDGTQSGALNCLLGGLPAEAGG
jgi:hypothetical protein